MAAGVTLTVRLVPVPPSTILLLGARVGFEEEPVTVKLVAAAPVWPTVNDNGPQLALALIVWLATAVMVGGGSALTVTPKLVELQSVPAHTVRVMVAVPVWLAAGVTVTVQLVPLPLSATLVLGTNVGFEDAAVTVNGPVEVPLWPTLKAKGPQLELT